MESLHHLFPLKSYFHFRFRGRHLSFRCRAMSDNVGIVILGSGVVENVEVAYRIASLCLSIQQLCQHACLASAILEFACRWACHVTNFQRLGFFLVQYCVGNCFEQRQCFVNDFEWFCDWVNAIFSKNAIFIGFFPIIAQSRDRKCKFLYTFREGSSRWTKWYITLVDTLPNKNVRGGRNPPPPPCTFAWPRLTCTCEC